ncbi:zinc finger protein 41-like [Musca vetustissima]|uniref:zinc finger protein 41-like n=1 Tax=Musca vetustissima TaxID=27455 RepID=UPI002AB69766|nr:zinc finger protein 41-like [Musca vetustissima]
MPDYNNFIKCGEILKSPTINEKEQFVFRCGCYADHYIELQSFVIPPCSKRFQESLVNFETNSLGHNVNANIKYEEDNINVEDVDPLNALYEDTKNPEIKEETTLNEPEECFNQQDNIFEDPEKDEQLSTASDDANWENLESDNESVESEDSDSPLFVHNFIKSQQNVISLIEEYKSYPILWKQKSPQYRLKKHHNKYLEKIKEDLKEKHSLQMSLTQIAAVITYLYRKYRHDFKRSIYDATTTLDEKTQPAWFLPHMEFLKPIVEKTFNTTITTNTTPECNLQPEQIIQVLGIYERFPHLWNTDLIENVCKNKRMEAIEEMRKVIEQEMNLEISGSALQGYLHFMHNHFSKLKRCHLIEAKPKPDKYFKHMQYLNDHIGPFQCRECAQIFKSPLTFKVHKSQHDGSEAIRCSLCQKEYSNPGPYIAHARRHMNDLNEECSECGKKFLVASDLKIHMRSHTGVQPYCCEICGISFRHSTSLNVHRRRHEEQYLHKCPICSKGFYKKDRMNDHIRSHNNVRDFACAICGKAFKTRKTLKQHEVIHDDARKHVCSLCGKAFKLKVGLLQHMRTHGGQI